MSNIQEITTHDKSGFHVEIQNKEERVMCDSVQANTQKWALKILESGRNHQQELHIPPADERLWMPVTNFKILEVELNL